MSKIVKIIDEGEMQTKAKKTDRKKTKTENNKGDRTYSERRGLDDFAVHLS